VWSNLKGEKYKEFFTDKHLFTIGMTWHWTYGLMVCYAYSTIWITIGPLEFYLMME